MKTIYTVRADNGQFEFNYSHSETREDAEKQLLLCKEKFPNTSYILEQEVEDEWGK